MSSTFDPSSVTTFKVALAETTFTAGGVVSGCLIFTVVRPVPFYRVSLKIVGKETAHMKQGYYYFTNVHKEQVTLLGGLKGTDFKGALSPGEYNFPFAFTLPLNAPPTVPAIRSRQIEATLVWYVKASIDVPNNQYASAIPVMPPASVANFTVATAMPISQFQARAPFASPSEQADRTCCCFRQGVATVQTNIDHNMLIFGRDTSLDGNISIDNSASKKDVQTVCIALHRVCWVRAHLFSRVGMTRHAYRNVPLEYIGSTTVPRIAKHVGTSRRIYQRTLVELVASSTIQSNMNAGDGEKRFNFSIPFPNTPNLVSCYRGHSMFYYYRMTATCDGDTLFTTNIVASNALDETNRSPPINVDTPGPLVPAKEYHKYVYAPPPGAQSSFPTSAPDIVPQPTSTVPYIMYGQPQPQQHLQHASPYSIMNDEDI